MAEVAPLTAAHAHARSAARETKTAHWVEAADEHGRAAEGFARAAKDTGDSEALRTLRLLELQHQKLAHIICSRATANTREVATETESTTANTNPNDQSTPPQGPLARANEHTASSPSSKTTPALAAARLNSRTRDASPNLARDIATRRGIPQPGKASLSPAAETRARQTSPDARRHAARNAASRIPPSIVDSQRKASRKPRKPDDDDGFASFYNNITTGTMSKLSSVLAYAGLPLASEELGPEPQPAKSEKRTVTATTSPDVEGLISKAALNAIETSHRERGTPGHVFGPAESFYVVQTGGGTYSYADITRPQPPHLGEDDEEAFVDAREAQTSPTAQRSSFGRNRTAEELELENSTLKRTLEHLAIRLQNFELHAQDASMMAITQSMASLHSSPTTPSHPASARDQQAAVERVRELEAQMQAQAEQREKLERLAEKQERKIRMYHAKWEEVKASAKERERIKREKAERGKEGKEGEEG